MAVGSNIISDQENLLAHKRILKLTKLDSFMKLKTRILSKKLSLFFYFMEFYRHKVFKRLKCCKTIDTSNCRIFQTKLIMFFSVALHWTVSGFMCKSIKLYFSILIYIKDKSLVIVKMVNKG